MTQSYTNWIERFWPYLTVPIFADMKREEAIALRDKHKPSSLFRYRALDKEREFENIEHQQVWLSQPVADNDPYDSSFTFRMLSLFGLSKLMHKTSLDLLLSLKISSRHLK